VDVYHARWVVPIDAPTVRDGALAVDGDRIVWVGPAADAPSGRQYALGDVAVLPGLVNAHAHLELTCYRNQVPRGSLWEWFDRLFELIRLPGAAERERQGVIDGARELLASGCTCVADISRTGGHWEALRESPIRVVRFVELISGARLQPNDLPSLAAAVDALAASDGERRRTGVAPHTLYTVTRDDLAAAAELARRRNLPLTLHLFETPEEIAWLAGGSGTPIDAMLEQTGLPSRRAALRGDVLAGLESTGVFNTRALLAHVNHIDDARLARLAQTPASVAFCPGAHAFFGHGPHRWREMLDCGLRVCIGTDSAASNAGLSMLAELRALHRGAPDLPAETIWAMGSLNGAQALGWANQIGSLSPGKRADFIAMPLPDTQPAQPLEALLDHDALPAGVWIDGVLVGDGAGEAAPKTS